MSEKASSKVPAILTYGLKHPWLGIIAVALGEDGKTLATFSSGTKEQAKQDLQKLPIYAEMYQKGYVIVWIENPETSSKVKRALDKNKRK